MPSDSFVMSQQITTHQFDFDKETNTFSSDSNRLALKGSQGERFSFFLMRGKEKSHQFIFTRTEIENEKVFDYYQSTKEPFYICRIERKQ